MIKKLLFLLLLSLGVGLLLQGLWIPAKAQVAQWLLQHAWQQAINMEPLDRIDPLP